MKTNDYEDVTCQVEGGGSHLQVVVVVVVGENLRRWYEGDGDGGDRESDWMVDDWMMDDGVTDEIVDASMAYFVACC